MTHDTTADFGDAEYSDLMEELRHAGELEQVAPDVQAAVQAAFIWRTIDAELAELTYDSGTDEKVLAGVRGPADAARMLTFESPALTVEVEAVEAGPHRRLVGQLVPPQPGQVEVRHAGGTVAAVADELGRFTADGIAAGPVSLRCQGIGTDAIVTDWVLL